MENARLHLCTALLHSIPAMLAGSQCRMARAALFWSVRELARRSGVSTTTITRFENEQTVPIKATLTVLKQTFEAGGAEFTNGDQPGVRLKRKG